MNEQNLIPNTERTPSELREITQRGGLKSGEVRRRKKLLAEVVRDIMNEKISNEPNALTRQEAFSIKVLTKIYNDKDGDAGIDDLLKLQKLMGEEKTTIATEVTMPDLQIIRK